MNANELSSGPRVNLGCGPIQPAGWINIDNSNRAYLASKLHWLDSLMVTFRLIPPTAFSKLTKYHDLSKGLPYSSNSIAYIYAGELWEHLELTNASHLTKECYRVLTPGGVLRVCVPDGPTFWGKYLQLYQEEMSKPRSDRTAKMLIEHTQMFFNDICTRKLYLGSMGHKHKWNFDEVQLIEMFEASGFSCVERMQFQKSRIPDVHRVERSDFLIVEGIK